jgi:hypothetical protein
LKNSASSLACALLMARFPHDDVGYIASGFENRKKVDLLQTVLLRSPLFSQSFPNRFNHFQISTPFIPIFACYTRIRRHKCRTLRSPYTDAPESSSSPTTRVTHLAKNSLPMRHKSPAPIRNLLKQCRLQSGVYELHTPPCRAGWHPARPLATAFCPS